MKKTHKTIKLLCLSLAAMLMFMLPFQVFAYMPSSTVPQLPEAVVGIPYRHRIFTAGFGKHIIWSEEGLPDGMEFDPVDCVIFGTAKKAGVFEVLVTAQSRWKWLPKRAPRRFLLYVSPPVVSKPDSAPDSPEDVPSVPDTPPSVGTHVPEASSVPDTSPQTSAELQNDTEPFTTQSGYAWLSLQANGKSGAETTTALYLTFSAESTLDAGNLDLFVSFADGKATPVSFSFVEITDEGYRYALSITLSETVVNGEHITLTLEGVHHMEPNLVSMPVAVHVATDASLAGLALDELVPELLLGGNASMDEIISDLVLPVENTEYACDIVWQSQYPEIISNAGAVTRPAYSEGDRIVILTASVTRGEAFFEKEFSFTVLAREREIEPAPPENAVEIPPETLPAVAVPKSSASSNSEATNTSVPAAIPASANVDKNGTVSRASIINELQTALQEAVKRFAAVRVKNAQSVSPKTLKALAAAAEAEGRQAVLYADTLTQIRKVDARLYLTPASLTSVTEPIKLGVATKGGRTETIKRFFEKYFDNTVSVISCEQQGSFGAKLQIAAKVQLPEDIGNLAFYSYDAETNSFSRILTAYRLDSNGYLRFATETAGDIIVSDGALKKR